MSETFDRAMFRRPLADADLEVAAAIVHEERRPEDDTRKHGSSGNRVGDVKG